ncbi:MAG: VWA domain-containing protein [Saprospiraceae bacterium]|nr:VWA domain-containing protein [Saprospiraceae bacterium]
MHNYQVGIEEVTTALKSIEYINLGVYADYILLLQICFARSKSQWNELAKNYEEFLKEYRQSLDSKLIQKAEGQEKPRSLQKQEKKYQLEDIKKWLFNISEKDALAIPFYSPFSSDEKSFVDLEEEDLLQLDFWVRKLLLKIANDRRRRKKRNLVRGTLDLKYLIRNRFRKGDELTQLYYRYPRKEKTKVVFLCDVSKSMDLYSRFITSFAKQLNQIFNHHAIYLFNTELHRVESEEIWQNVPGLWSGGTRIGSCLQAWLADLPHWFDRKTKVIIYSDGWDTGDLDRLDQTMYLIQHLANKVFWFNPVLKDENDIQVSGMKVAMEYVDVLAPVYNLSTLKELVRIL